MADNSNNMNPDGLVPDSDLLLSYLKREMSNAEKHELEKRMLGDDFLADAAEGLTSVNNPLVIADLTAQINAKLNTPGAKPSTPKRSPLSVVGNTLAVAASIALLVVAAYFISQNVSKDKAITLSEAKKETKANEQGTVNEHNENMNAPLEERVAADSVAVVADEKPTVDYSKSLRNYRYKTVTTEGQGNASEDVADIPAYDYEQPASPPNGLHPVTTNGTVSQVATGNYNLNAVINDKYGPASNNYSYSQTPVLDKGKTRKKNVTGSADTIADTWGNRTAIVDDNTQGGYVDGVLIRKEDDIDTKQEAPAKKLSETPIVQGNKNKDAAPPVNKQAEKSLTRGLDRYNKGDYKSAISDLEDALKKDPTNQKAIYSLAMAYKNTNRPDNAIVQFNKIPAGSPYYENAKWEIANIYLNKNDDANCIATLKAIVKLNGAYKIRAQNMINNLEEQAPKKSYR